MDIPVNAAKPGRRRYLTLVMILITVVICYVDRANLAVASAHIQEEFGITVGGFFKPLTKPGLGVEIDEAKVIEFSKNAPDWRNPLWRHEDNSVAEW